MYTSATYLDGNAAAGPMAEVFEFDITSTVGQCAGCGARHQMADVRVFPAGPGLVLRCPGCDHVLARLAVTQDRTWLDMSGLAYLMIDRTEPAPAAGFASLDPDR